jgi:hypothetical protein
MKNLIKGVLKEYVDDLTYTNPNFDSEWGEAERYIEHPNINKRIQWTKEEWLNKVQNGKVIRFSEIKNLQNISDPTEFKKLFPEKVERFINALSKKEIELPIAVKLPNGTYELVAGNTRVTGLRNKGYDPKIWVFEI